jgi:hypothetical protein
VIGAGQLQNLETAKYRPATKRIFQQSAQNPASRVVTRCRVLGGAPVPIGKPETGTLLTVRQLVAVYLWQKNASALPIQREKLR